MKKSLLISVALLFVVSVFAQVLLKGSKKKQTRQHFSVVGEVVYFDSKPLAKYQAKTFSLDNGELVEEYNLLLIDKNLQKTQIIGDLIDYISDRHKGAEVEIEIEPSIGLFTL